MKTLMSFPSTLGPNIPLSTLFTNILSQCKVRDRVSHQYKTRYKTVVSCVLIFTFLDSQLLGCTISWTEWRHGVAVCTALCHLSLARPIVLNLQKHTVGATKITLLPVPCHMFRPGHSHSIPNVNIRPFIPSLNHNKLITCDPHLTQDRWQCMSNDNLHYIHVTVHRNRSLFK